MSEKRKSDFKAYWVTPFDERPVLRRHLAALDFLKGMTLVKIKEKYGYSGKENVSNDIRRVLSQNQIDRRHRRFGVYFGSKKKSFREPFLLERTVDLKKSGYSLSQIASIERISARAVRFRLSRARKLGLLKDREPNK